MAENEKTAPKRRGRPPAQVPLSKRVNIMFRLTEMTRGRVMRIAEESGRSMSEELERRVEQSLSKDVRLYSLTEMVGGKNGFLFASSISGNMRIAIDVANAEIKNDEYWYEDDKKLDRVKRHMRETLDSSIDAYASLMRSGTAQRAGNHSLEARDGFQDMLPDQVSEAIIEAYQILKGKKP